MATFTETWGQALPQPTSSFHVSAPGSASFCSKSDTSSMARTHTQGPIVTGTSVVGLMYSDGILLAADCLASYGSLARFKDVQRIHSIGTSTILGSSGDIGDLQFLLSQLKQLNISERYTNDTMTPKSYFHLIRKTMYERRSKMQPLWNSHVVAGIQPDGEKYFALLSQRILGCVNLLGGMFESESVATGFGAHLAQPILRQSIEEKAGGSRNLTIDEAKAAVDRCMRVLYYRDARSLNKIQYGHISSSGQVQISEPLLIDTDWSVAAYN